MWVSGNRFFHHKGAKIFGRTRPKREQSKSRWEFTLLLARRDES